MHEVDLTRCLLLSLEEWRDQHSPRIPLVSAVRLQVGEFTCVEPDALVTTWSSMLGGHWLEGSRLEIERIPLVGRCLPCGRPYAPSRESAYRSPCCQHPLEEILSGRELKIHRIDYHYATSPTALHEPALPSDSPR